MLLKIMFIVLVSTGVYSADVKFGRYPEFFPSVVFLDKVKIENASDPTIYRTMAVNPKYYYFDAPKGEYKITVHYVAEKDDQGSFSVEVNGVEKVPNRPCYLSKNLKNREEPLYLKALTVSFTVKAEDLGLRVRFVQSVEQSIGICGIEVIGTKYTVRVDSGSNKPYTDSSGVKWDADAFVPIPDVEISLDAVSKPGQWVNISEEIINKLVKAGVEPGVKGNGASTREFSAIITDYDGNTFINLSYTGLWSYGGPGGKLKRVDGGIYTACMMAISANPYGPGFYLFSTWGFSGETYEIMTLDGKNFSNFKGSCDYGSVDWTEYPPKTVVTIGHHKGSISISGDGAKTFAKYGGDTKLSAVCALPKGVLIKCITAGKVPGKNIPGIYRSTDLGKNWDKVSDIDVGNTFLPAANYKERVYIHSPNGLVVSNDSGKTWVLIKGSPAFTYTVQFSKDDSLMMGFNKEGGFESKDRGLTWKNVVPPPPPVTTTVKNKYTTQHVYYDFAWDFRKNIVYAFAPGVGFRYEFKK